MASTAQQNSTNPKVTTKISAVNYAKRFTASLKRYLWLLAAFFIPLAIRSIPEIISWPYPLGLDTLRYIPVIESGRALSDLASFFHNQLFYSLGTLAYWITGDAIFVIKVLGPVLMGCVALMMYLYARCGLGWGNFKSFLVSLLVGVYFVSLRNSWDLYAQSLGLIFLFATLIILKSSSSYRRFGYAFIFMVLTVLSHQLIAVILFFILGLEAFRFLFKKSYGEFTYLFLSLGVVGGLFILRLYSFSTGSIVVPTASAVSEPSLSFGLTFGGLLLYAYGLLLPFVAACLVWLKDWFMRFWVIWCFGAPLLLIVFPSLPLYYWPRWFYLLVYPLLFFAVEGLTRLYNLWYSHKNKIKRLLPKAAAATYVIMLLVLCSYYVSQRPENQINFFSTDNPYLTYIPSSMLQNTLSITSNPSLVNCFNWINDNSADDSVLVIHYALYDLARIYADGKIVHVNHSPSIYVHLQNETALTDDLVAASIAAQANGNSTVYTVWWINGKGWYQVPSLPSEFLEVYRIDDMAVYIFTDDSA
jgi:hypothetical protein